MTELSLPCVPPGDFDPDFVRYERYRDPRGRSRLRRAYYHLKPHMPRWFQLLLRRRYARFQQRQSFPAWPIEPILVNHQLDEFRAKLRASAAAKIPFVNFWPEGRRFCFILTHDVEGTDGIANVERVREVERRYGFVSSWNFVAEDYPIPNGLFQRLRDDGCEIGLHGIRHDDSLFRDRRGFEATLPSLATYVEKWGVVGFRSPATHRNAEWMHELPCLYDSSFPDTDPFEPVAGGCCSIFPFLFGSVVELPITLVQDHTLFEILREPSIAHWLAKSRWIIEHHGLVNVIVHPDYMLEPSTLDRYGEFLSFLAHEACGWHALPCDVARWWSQRAALVCGTTPEGADRVRGEADFAATVAYAYEQDGSIIFDVGLGGPRPESAHPRGSSTRS